jgi:chloramphenicol 3-O-phosphotransferase
MSPRQGGWSAHEVIAHPGLARSRDVFRHHDRDIAIDTTQATAEACAITIATELPVLSSDKAFNRLRRLRP